jgi:hypothetical protein
MVSMTKSFFSPHNCITATAGYKLIIIIIIIIIITMDVGPCHHGMARPRVADGGTASYMEGSCE